MGRGWTKRYVRRVILSVGVALWSFVTGLLSLPVNAMPEAAQTAAAAQTPSVGGGVGVSAQGQVTQSYGFSLPPARLMPSLSLSYGSNGGDSDIGYGWSLVAGSRISRDFRREAAVLDARDDHYTVDGVSLLRMGAAGSTDTTLYFERWGDVSRTQYEFDIESNIWTERTRQGLIRRYRVLLQQQGTVANAASMQDGAVPLRRRSGMKSPSDRTPADRSMVWALSEEEDRDGNQVAYFYEVPSSDPRYRDDQFSPMLVEIRYGGNVRLGTLPIFVVSIGRYMHQPPVQIATLAPTNARSGQCEGRRSLIGEGLPSYRMGGLLVGGEGQRVYGIGVSVANGASTDASVFATTGALSQYWRLGSNFDRVGCMNANELHANLETIEPFGRNPASGELEAGPVTRYEYHGWERHWTRTEHRLAGGGALQRQLPTEATVMGGLYSEESTPAGRYVGHWPNRVNTCPGGGPASEGCLQIDAAGAPATVQMLRDENGDAIPDYVDFLSAKTCNRFAAGLEPTFSAGRSDGSFGMPQPLSWGRAVMDAHTGPGLQEAYCGAELWRSNIGSVYAAATTAVSNQAAFLGFTANESYSIDVDADGYADTIRLVGNQRLTNHMLIDPAPEAAFGWKYYRKNRVDLSTEGAREFAQAPWVNTEIGLSALVLQAGNQNVSATVRNATGVHGNGYGFDYSSSETGSLVDLTGDGVPDRLAAMRVGRLVNQPYPRSTAYGEHAIPEDFALTVYRGQLVLNGEGNLELKFNETPEFWWTRAEGNQGLGEDLDEERLAPATSATLRYRCYGMATPGCVEMGLGVSQLVDLNGDGLLDIVMTAPKLTARFTGTELRGGGSYQLEPITVLYNTGRGFTRFQIGLSTPASVGGLPQAVSSTVLDPSAEAIRDGAREGHNYEQIERVQEQVADFNGDGFADLVQAQGVRIGGAGQLSAPLAVSMPVIADGMIEKTRVVRWLSDHGEEGDADWQESREQLSQLVDMNGDGRVDLLVLDLASHEYDLITDADLSVKPGALKAAYDGLGGKTEYSYQTIAQALGNEARGVPAKGFVVSTIKQTLGSSADSGPERVSKVSFSEGHDGRSSEGRDDGQLAVLAAGFLGFGKVTTEHPSGQKTVEYYDYSWGHEGRLLKQETQARDGDMLSRTTQAYRDVALHTRRWVDGQVQPADVGLLESTTQETWHEVSPGRYDARPVVRRLRYEYRLDLSSYGQPEQILDDGDVDDAQDDTRTQMSYQSGAFEDTRGKFYSLVVTDSKTYGYNRQSGAVDKLLAHTRNDYDCDPDGTEGGYRCSNIASEATRVRLGLLRQSLVFFENADEDEKALRTRYYYGAGDNLLLHQVQPSGRVSSYCYDPHHLYAVLTRSADGLRNELAYNTATGALIERRGWVGLSARALVGAPGVRAADADSCAAVDGREPKFGGQMPRLSPTPLGKAQDTPELVKELQAIPLSTSITVPSYSTESSPPSSTIAYSRSNDPITAALRDRRQVPPGYDVARSSLRLPWIIVGLNSARSALGTGWVEAPEAIATRRPSSPTQHTEYDGLGRELRSYASTQRQADRRYQMTQLNENAQGFADGRDGGPAGVYGVSQRLIAGSSYTGTDAKKHWQSYWQDSAGQTLWSQSLATATQAPQQFRRYGIEGLPTRILSPDPAAPSAYAATELSEFDDYNVPRVVSQSAGSAVRRESSIRWQADGPHYLMSTYQGASTAAMVKVSEVESIPRRRSVISRTFVQAGSEDAQVIQVTSDEFGRPQKVISREGQVTTYVYDLAGRPILTARYNSEADLNSKRALEVIESIYPDYNDAGAPERYITNTTSYGADGSLVVAQVMTELDRQSGRVVRVLKPGAIEPPLLGYGDTRFSYITHSDLDGYGQVSQISNPNEVRTMTYNAQQLVESTTHDYVVRWPAHAAQWVERLVYTQEYEPSGLIRRSTVNTDGSATGRFTTRYEYDEAGNVSEVWDESTPSTIPVESYAYTGVGQLESRQDSRGGVKRLSYDHHGLLRESSLTAPGLSVPYVQTITRDPVTGRPTRIDTTRSDLRNLSATYDYDLAGQLIQANENGYRAEIHYRCNADRCDQRIDTLNESIPGGSNRNVRYQYADSYDQTQLTSQVSLADGSTRSYRYDAGGALQQSPSGLTYENDLLGQNYGHKQGGYLYDASENQRIQYLKAPDSDTPSVAYAHLPGLEIEYRLDASGNLTRSAMRRYVGGERRNVLNSEDARVESDVLGNVALIRGGSNAYASYTAFGQLIPERSNNFNNEWFGYKGGRIDKTGTGFYRFGARSYDPATNRWISRDPIRTQLAHADPYAAFDNNPIINIDPSGLQSVPGAATATKPPDDGSKERARLQDVARRADYVRRTGDRSFNNGSLFSHFMRTGSTDGFTPPLRVTPLVSLYPMREVQPLPVNPEVYINLIEPVINHGESVIPRPGLTYEESVAEGTSMGVPVATVPTLSRPNFTDWRQWQRDTIRLANLSERRRAIAISQHGRLPLQNRRYRHGTPNQDIVYLADDLIAGGLQPGCAILFLACQAGGSLLTQDGSDAQLLRRLLPSNPIWAAVYDDGAVYIHVNNGRSQFDYRDRGNVMSRGSFPGGHYTFQDQGRPNFGIVLGESGIRVILFPQYISGNNTFSVIDGQFRLFTADPPP